MKRVLITVLLIAVFAGVAFATRTVEIFFIDVEGGQSTLIVTPSGESLLIDAGYGGREGRDPARILAAAREARLDRIDYLLITHYHPDHVGGVPELASQIPIGTFVDHGDPPGTGTGYRGFSAYESVRREGLHIQARPGDRLPLEGIEADVVSADGKTVSEPLGGGGQMNEMCASVEDYPEDRIGNFRSIGLMIRFGSFRFLDLADLSGNMLTRLVCPRNLLGTASVYLIAHHGEHDSNVPALYAALRPRVAVMNNAATKGGSPDAFRTLHALPGLEDLWQLHASRHHGAQNSPEHLIANVDDGLTSYWIKLTAFDDGSFRIVNSRTGFTKTYSRRSTDEPLALLIPTRHRGLE